MCLGEFVLAIGLYCLTAQIVMARHGGSGVHPNVNNLTPGTPQAVYIGHDHITLKWDQPKESSSLIKGYRLWYSTSPSKQLARWVEIPGNTPRLNTTITGLKPNTRYFFGVLAPTSRGLGFQSNTANYTTLSDPGPSIYGLSARQLKPDVTSVFWKTPIKFMDYITGYIVYYTRNSKMDHDAWLSQTVWGANHVNIKYLDAGETYYFKVKPRTRTGYGQQSLIVKYTVPQDLFSAPVIVGIERIGKDPYSAHIEWEHGDWRNRNATGYLVYYATKMYHRHERWGTELVNSGRSVSIRNLKPDSFYYFKVQAWDSNGKGPMSKAVGIKIPKSALLPLWMNPVLAMPHSSLAKLQQRFASDGIYRTLIALNLNFQKTIQVAEKRGSSAGNKCVCKIRSSPRKMY